MSFFKILTFLIFGRFTDICIFMHLILKKIVCTIKISKSRIINNNMNTFTKITNPIIGVSSWALQPENYDFHQEIARAGFGDMLHDTERNQKYYITLRKTIKNIHDNGKEVHVLDIGAGTGILSMMAVECGADSVTACEAFRPMADCAEEIIKMNKMINKIKLIKKRSTDIIVGNENSEEDCDMKRRANVLVTELFDTELIGEGAIGIFNHAHENLLTDDCVIIPDSASCYIQVVESSLANSWNKPKLLANLEGEVLLQTPTKIIKCLGEPGVHDVQLSQFPIDKFKALSDPAKIFDFNFTSDRFLSTERNNDIKLIAKNTGISQLLFFWWDLKMDQQHEIILSCAPYWCHPDFKKFVKNSNLKSFPMQNSVPWRDHWMQAIYYLPEPVLLSKDKEFILNSYHDEYSFWFNIVGNSENLQKIKKFSCSCSFHMAYSRNRIGQLNNNTRNKKYMQILEEQVNDKTVVLCLSEGSLLGLAAKNLNANSVICFEPQRMSYGTIKDYIDQNKLTNVTLIKNLEEIKDFDKISLVFAEPFYTTSILPWDNFYFGTLLNQIYGKLKKDIFIMPLKAKILAVPVEFLDLHKIRMPLKQCEGFNLEIFDKMIEDSSKVADSMVEAQPLWEYPCKALGDAKEVLSVDFLSFNKELNENGKFLFKTVGACNGIALWVDWYLNGTNNPKYIVSTGPNALIQPGKFISWDMCTRQGVHLFLQPQVIKPSDNYIEYDVTFKPSTGDINFSFKIL